MKSNSGKVVVKSTNTTFIDKYNFISNFYNNLKSKATSFLTQANNSSIALFISAHGEEQVTPIITNILKFYPVLESEKNSISTFVKNSLNAVVVTPQVCAPMTDTIKDDAGNITKISSARADVVLVQDLYTLFYTIEDLSSHENLKSVKSIVVLTAFFRL